MIDTGWDASRDEDVNRPSHDSAYLAGLGITEDLWIMTMWPVADRQWLQQHNIALYDLATAAPTVQKLFSSANIITAWHLASRGNCVDMARWASLARNLSRIV